MTIELIFTVKDGDKEDTLKMLFADGQLVKQRIFNGKLGVTRRYVTTAEDLLPENVLAAVEEGIEDLLI